MSSSTLKASPELAGAVRAESSEADAFPQRQNHDASTLCIHRTASTDSSKPLLQNPIDFARQWLHKVPDDSVSLETRSPSLGDPVFSNTIDRSASKKTPRYRPSIAAVKKASKQGLILRRAASLTGLLPAVVTAAEPNPSLTAGQSVFHQLDAAQEPHWRATACDWLDGTYTSCFVVLVTLLAVFLDDFRLAVLPPAADPVCTGITIFIFVVFVIDTTAGSFVRPGYAFRFYW